MFYPELHLKGYLVDTSPEGIGFEILYENGPCLVVSKPGGIATQAPRGIDSLEVRVKQFLQTREQKTGHVYLGVPHRLDRPVSGILVVAMHVRATRRIAEQFQRRSVEKRYWAIVQGDVQPAQGSWSDTLRKVPDVARVEVVPPDHPEGKYAELRYRVLSRGDGCTWVEIELLTGRMHQIRVQCSQRGFPVLGDHAYGASDPFGPVAVDNRQRWIALHARGLRFQHPMTREVVDCSAPVPWPWRELALWPEIEATR